jgi:hypothetical protein
VSLARGEEEEGLRGVAGVGRDRGGTQQARGEAGEGRQRRGTDNLRWGSDAWRGGTDLAQFTVAVGMRDGAEVWWRDHFRCLLRERGEGVAGGCSGEAADRP